MSEFLRSYLTVVVFGVAAIVMVGAMLGVGSLLRPKRPQPEKYLTYESGVDPVGSMWSQSEVRYYFFALLFVFNLGMSSPCYIYARVDRVSYIVH